MKDPIAQGTEYHTLLNIQTPYLYVGMFPCYISIMKQACGGASFVETIIKRYIILYQQQVPRESGARGVTFDGWMREYRTSFHILQYTFQLFPSFCIVKIATSSIMVNLECKKLISRYSPTGGYLCYMMDGCEIIGPVFTYCNVTYQLYFHHFVSKNSNQQHKG